MYRKIRQQFKSWLFDESTAEKQRFVDFYELEPRVLFSATPVDVEALDIDLENYDLDLDDITLPSPESFAALDQVDSLLQSLENLEQSDFLSQPDPLYQSEPTQSKELVFIASDVENADILLAGLSDNAEVIQLSADEDGLEIITQELAKRTGLTAVHLVTHGSDTSIALGTNQLQLDSIDSQAATIQQWNSAFAEEADILIYGCDVAKSNDGQQLIELIAEAVQVDVAASDDVTGNDVVGGDWDLEYRSGKIETGLAFSYAARTEWLGSLATFYVTSSDDAGAGTLRWAIDQANANSGHDTINFAIPVITAETIDLFSTLEITDTVTIDATTQIGYAGEPLVALDGSGISNREIMLLAAGSDGSSIRGFAFINSLEEGLLVESDGNTIQSNYFGVDTDGTTAAANRGGLRIRTDHNIIGGSDTQERNIFSGNTEYGLRLSNSAGDNYVQGNYVGLDANGNALGNANRGVYLTGSSSDNFIGGTSEGEGNIIAHNATDGITLATSGNGNSLRGNLIYSNGGGVNDLPIDLDADGPTNNDISLLSSDDDSGANDLQNYPEIYSARYDGYTLTVRGRQTGPNNQNMDLDFYSGVGLQGNGLGNAEQYLGSEVSQTGFTGQDFFTIQLTGLNIEPDSFLSATATNEDGSTSEFSAAVEIVDVRSSLLFVTGGDVSGSGTPGETDWTDEDILEFRGDSYGAGSTNGEVAYFADMGRFESSDFSLDGLHFVGSSLTIGSGAETVDLKYGDLLLTINESKTFFGSFNSLSVENDDVFIFRPDSIDSYASGKFYMLFDSPTGNEINAITLVESATGITLADGTHLAQGTLLFSENGSTKDVSMFVADSAGDVTSGTTSLLLDGGNGNLDFNKDVSGLAIVEEDKSMGGVDLEAGDLFVTFDSDDNDGVGGNGVNISEDDVAAIRLTNTEIGSAISNGTATRFFDGSVIGLTDAGEEVSALSFATSTSSAVATANLAPTDVNLSNTFMAENTDSSLGQPVGRLATVDGDSTDFTYQVVTSYGDGALFSIGGLDNNELILTDTNLPDGILDFETKPSYDVRVRSTDDTGLRIVRNFVVTITDNNDAPVITAQTFNIDENTTNVGSVVATDQDGDSLTYSIANNIGDNGLFSINSATGELSFIASPDYESPADDDAGNDYEVDVIVNDGTTTETALVTVSVDNVNEPPVAIATQPDLSKLTTSRPETIDLSTLFSDPDSGDALTFTAISSDPTSTSTSVVDDELTLTFLADGSATITIIAKDSSNETASSTFDVIVTPNRPPIIDTNRLTIAENSPVGASVGTVVANPGELGATLTYTITGGSGLGIFDIDTNTGEVTVLDSSPLDFESNKRFRLDVEVTDDNGLVSTERVRINVLDVNEGPTTSGISDKSVLEDARKFNINLNDHFSDVDQGDKLTYTLVGNSNPSLNSVEINGNQLRIQPNSDAYGTSNLTIRATDRDGEFVNASFDVNVASVNDAPSATGERFVIEAEEALQSSDLLSNDFDVENDPLTAILVTGPSNGQLTLNPDGSFSYEPEAEFAGKDTFTYKVSDGDKESEAVTVVVDVITGGFTPVIVPPPEPTISEERENDYEEEIEVETESAQETLEEVLNPHSENRELEAGSDVAEGEAHQFKFGSEKQKQATAAFSVGGSDAINQNFISIFRPESSRSSESINDKLAASIEQITTPTSSSDAIANSRWLWEALDEYNAQIETESNLPRILIGGTAGIASGISVGYLIWLVRGGQILAAVMANLPAWSLIDPLPVLSRIQPDDGSGDGESLQAIIEKSENKLDQQSSPAASPAAEKTP